MGYQPVVPKPLPDPPPDAERNPLGPEKCSELSACLKGTLHPRGDPRSAQRV